MRASLIVLLGCFLSASTWAASVTQIKNNKLILQLDGESMSPGTEVYILNSSGKKIGLVSIKTVKGTRALGEITKGRANVGDQAQIKGAAGSHSDQKSASRSRRSQHTGGVLVGYIMDSMSLTVQHPTVTATKEDVTLKGSSFSAKAFYDYKLSSDIVVRGATGLEGFSVTGTTSQAICNNGSSTSCTVESNYLAFEGSAHYNFLTGQNIGWVGLGYSFLVAMTKKNDIPNLSDTSTNQMILVGAGADIGLSGGSFIPVVVEYGIFPGSSNVSANSINIRSGYGMSF
jgi:hypothetical protein